MCFSSVQMPQMLLKICTQNLYSKVTNRTHGIVNRLSSVLRNRKFKHAHINIMPQVTQRFPSVGFTEH